MALILGLGIDLVEVRRIEAAFARSGQRLLDRLFTPHEQATAGTGPHRFRRLAARLAAKEALLKALGTGLRDGRWLDAAVANDDLGKPYLQLSGTLAERARRLGVVDMHLSLTHENNYASACVVLVGHNPAGPVTPDPCTPAADQ